MSSVSGKAFDLNLLRRTMVYVRPFKKTFWTTTIVAVAISVFAPVRPWITQYALDNYVLKKDLNGLALITAILVGVLIIQFILQFIYTTLTNFLGQEVILQLRKDLYNRLLEFKLSFFDKTAVGTMVTRLVSDMETIADIFSDGLILIISDLLQVIIIVAVMLFISPKLALISLVTIPVLLYATRIFQIKIKDVFKEVRTQVARLNEFVQEHLTGIRIIQVFNREKEEYKKFDEINLTHRKANIDSVWYYSIFFPIVEILSATSIALIVWYGGGEVLRSEVTFGVLVAFIQYINMLFRPIRELADKFNTLQMGMVSSERIFKLMDEGQKQDNRGKIVAQKIKGDIVFENVWFAYKENEWVLKNISFKIESGKMIALVGVTGSGKTTIISLLNRFYEIQKGRILIDGIDINDYELHSLRSQIAVVLQDVFLFSDSIHNNITLYDTSIAVNDVEEAGKQVGIHNFIENLPKSYNFNVMERGTLLSAGQRQLISFARAYAHKPSILILDEATSNIDSTHEALINKATEAITQNRTSIVIAHRLATVKRADVIFVLQNGEIAEAGNHNELIQKNGIYSQLYYIQFKKHENTLA
ncbi:MAG TPA: ABC transporter ATP-binding protein [Bacteroidia bacterium]|nr:ABC transporter ATP-binding protein [Bacteroidia bacterium]HNU34113.1 ABC transporter ATP-binding protein [Bacteroidia bacterium]